MEKLDVMKLWDYLHSIPELGFKEFKTAAFLANELEKLGYKVTRNVGGTGVIGELSGTEEGPTIMLRADMDALPFVIDGKDEVIHEQVVSVGSVGKLLPVVLVQGKAVQIGSYYEGINPILLLSEIVCSTEGDENLVEICGNEATVPPVWNFMRDLKDSYDFSLPQRAVGYCNILTFYKTPADIMQLFLEKCQLVVDRMQLGRKDKEEIKIMPYSELFILAQKKKGFATFFAKLQHDIEEVVHATAKNVTVELDTSIAGGVAKMLRLENVAAGGNKKISGDKVPYSLEELVNRDPSVIFLTSMVLNLLLIISLAIIGV